MPPKKSSPKKSSPKKPAPKKPAPKKPTPKKPAPKKPAPKKPKQPTTRPSPAVLEAFPYQGTGLAFLAVQSNADHDSHRSAINVCGDFSVEDPAEVFVLPAWVYAMWMPSDDVVYLAHSGKVLRRGTVHEPLVVLSHDQDVTRLCAARRGVYVVGLGGYVGHFDDEKLVDLRVPDCETIHHVSEAPDGTLYAAGDHGRVFRRDRTTWTPIAVAPGGNLHHVVALDERSALFAGDGGVCGRIDGTKVTTYDAPTDRDYYAIAVFGGRTYFGAGRRGLDVLDGNAVVVFKDNIHSSRLFANEHYLFASGMNEAARYDGAAWLATAVTE